MGYSTENIQSGDIAVTLDYLEKLIGERKANPDEGSYTSKLLQEDEDKLLMKIIEEGGELILAAKERDHAHIRYELGDLLYHLMVFMQRYEISLDELAGELNARKR